MTRFEHLIRLLEPFREHKPTVIHYRGYFSVIYRVPKTYVFKLMSPTFLQHVYTVQKDLLCECYVVTFRFNTSDTIELIKLLLWPEKSEQQNRQLK